LNSGEREIQSIPRTSGAREECRVVAAPEPEQQGLRPSSIAGRGFSLGRRGYEPEEVHEFLREVAEYVSRLQGEVEWLRARSEHLERRSVAAQESAYARLSRDFMEVVRRTDEAAGRVRHQAEARAQSDLLMARRDAERIVGEARLEAERILAAARLEAHEMEWQSKGPNGWPSHHRQNEWPATADATGVDVPTASMDIGAIWELEDEESRPDVWRINDRPERRDHPSNEPTASSDPEDLDFYLDVSIFDLFENPRD
jgi:DivIVA domain-containing protein